MTRYGTRTRPPPPPLPFFYSPHTRLTRCPSPIALDVPVVVLTRCLSGSSSALVSSSCSAIVTLALLHSFLGCLLSPKGGFTPPLRPPSLLPSLFSSSAPPLRTALLRRLSACLAARRRPPPPLIHHDCNTQPHSKPTRPTSLPPVYHSSSISRVTVSAHLSFGLAVSFWLSDCYCRCPCLRACAALPFCSSVFGAARPLPPSSSSSSLVLPYPHAILLQSFIHPLLARRRIAPRTRTSSTRPPASPLSSVESTEQRRETEKRASQETRSSAAAGSCE